LPTVPVEYTPAVNRLHFAGGSIALIIASLEKLSEVKLKIGHRVNKM